MKLCRFYFWKMAAGIYIQFLKGNTPNDYSKRHFFSAIFFLAISLLYVYVFLTLYSEIILDWESSCKETKLSHTSRGFPQR